MLRRFAALAALALLVLTGCSRDEPSIRGAWVQQLPDGRGVTCVFAGARSGQAISCDWENAK